MASWEPAGLLQGELADALALGSSHLASSLIQGHWPTWRCPPASEGFCPHL